MSRAAAVVQARMGSSRLPGKILMLLDDRPLLGVILDRLRCCRSIDQIIVATTVEGNDEPVLSFCKAQRVACFRGSTEDVLTRTINAAEKVGAEIVVRVTGDAPWIDPTIIDQEVESLRRSGSDYAHVDPETAVVLEGFETVRLEALRRVDRIPNLEPRHREHVTTYIRENLDEFRVEALESEPILHQRSLKLSVDTPAELRFHAEVYRRIGERVPDVRELLRLLDRDSALAALAPRPVRKRPGEASHRFLLCMEAGGCMGWGHLVRQRALGRCLNESHACGIIYALGGSREAEERIREERLPVLRMPEEPHEHPGFLADAVREHRIEATILDVQTPVTPALVRSVQAVGSAVALVDNSGEGRLWANLVVDPGLHHEPDEVLRPCEGEYLEGGAFSLLNEQVVAHPQRPPGRILEGGRPPRLLVTMGGSDPAGMTLLAVRALEPAPYDAEVSVLMGPDFQKRAELEDLMRSMERPPRCVTALDDPASLYEQADAAVACFGVTVYELAYLGVPTLMLSHSPANARAAARLADHGFSVDLGYHLDTDPDRIRRAVVELMEQPEQLRDMADRGQECIDGGGIGRIAERILALASCRRAVGEGH